MLEVLDIWNQKWSLLFFTRYWEMWPWIIIWADFLTSFFLMQSPWLSENKPLSPWFWCCIFFFSFSLALAYFIKDLKFSKWKQVTSRRRKPFWINLFLCNKMWEFKEIGCFENNLRKHTRIWEGGNQFIKRYLRDRERDRKYCMCPSVGSHAFSLVCKSSWKYMDMHLFVCMYKRMYV